MKIKIYKKNMCIKYLYKYNFIINDTKVLFIFINL